VFQGVRGGKTNVPSFVRSRYLGGEPRLGNPIDNTYLWIDDYGIYVGMIGKKRAVSWDEIVGMEFTDGTTAKAPKSVLAGVRGVTRRTTITVQTRTGEQLYQVDRTDSATVRAAALPFLAKQ
jgi:hypothetical protein